MGKASERDLATTSSTSRQPSTSSDPDDLTPKATPLTWPRHLDKNQDFLAVLSAAHWRIDEVTISILQYFDGRIADLCKEREVRLDEIHCSLVLAQCDISEI